MQRGRTQSDRMTRWGPPSSGAGGAGEPSSSSGLRKDPPSRPLRGSRPSSVRLATPVGASPHGQGHTRLESEAGEKEHEASADCVPVSFYSFFLFFFFFFFF